MNNMVSPKSFSSLTLELKIIEATNIESKPRGNLYVRYYLSGEDKKKKVRFKTKEISTRNDLVWNQSFSLDCCGTGHQGFIDVAKLKQEILVFELRWRKRVPLLGRLTFGGSKLLGKAEIAWKEVIESPNMVLDKWVTIVNSVGGDRALEGVVKPAKLKVEIRVRVWKAEEILENRRVRMGKKNWDECGCQNGHHRCCTSSTCDHYDIFL
ncbi:C2 domain containing protein [Parasponia andersonii]|uniref:C2 domain containing protein n=1 Tax=Parasponia andersonii TaxID=3476 RepID=A0A2P5A6Z1_PARAD|nr:C2 domain containing protein [Parasponia andersonii]